MPKKKEAPASPFVPAEKQPYPIPENWRWVKLGSLYEINPKVIADETVLASFVPMERIEAGMTGKFTFEIQPWGKARKNHTLQEVHPFLRQYLWFIPIIIHSHKWCNVNLNFVSSSAPPLYSVSTGV